MSFTQHRRNELGSMGFMVHLGGTVASHSKSSDVSERDGASLNVASKLGHDNPLNKAWAEWVGRASTWILAALESATSIASAGVRAGCYAA